MVLPCRSECGNTLSSGHTLREELWLSAQVRLCSDEKTGEGLSLADTAGIVGNTKGNGSANLLSKPMYNVHIDHTSHKSGGL